MIDQLATTYSIVAHDADTGQLGVGVQTHQMAVGRLVPWLQPGVGAVATQSLVNISYGPNGLKLLAGGASPAEAVQRLTDADERAFHRQLGIVGADGRAAAFTGEHCIANAGHHVGEGYTVHANMMANNTVISAMRQGYETTDGDLAGRILAALQAAEAEGGDIRGKQSAALVVVPGGGEGVESWTTVYDLRVDESDDPLAELARLVRMRRAQLVSGLGDRAFAEGDKARALQLWAQSRAMSPEQEELAFWQSMTLADEGDDIEGAVAVFEETFGGRADREQWLVLILRLEEARLVQREGAARAFVTALQGQ